MKERGNIDIIGRTRIWFTLSGIIIGAGIIFMIINAINPQLNYGRHYPLKLGIDFTGGNVYRLVYNVDYNTGVADKAALQAGIHDLIIGMSKTNPVVQAGKNEAGLLVIQIRTDETIKETDRELELKADVLSIVKESNPEAELSDESEDFVGPVIGRELAYRGLMGLVIGAILILGYVSLRMSFDFAVCAIIALLHDVLVLCGVFALIQVEIDSAFVAAILTVVGYSINDTIVIFDRVRENAGLKRGMPFPDMVNLSLVQTLPRSINTSLTTLFPLVSLLLFGGPTIKNFILALLVGIISGTYSSIFTASPFLVAWRESKRMRSLAAKELVYRTAATGEGKTAAPKPAPATVTGDGEFSPAMESRGEMKPSAHGGDIPAPRPSYGPGKTSGAKKKKKRKR